MAQDVCHGQIMQESSHIPLPCKAFFLLQTCTCECLPLFHSLSISCICTSISLVFCQHTCLYLSFICIFYSKSPLHSLPSITLSLMQDEKSSLSIRVKIKGVRVPSMLGGRRRLSSQTILRSRIE